jgi:hypothetical protein
VLIRGQAELRGDLSLKGGYEHAVIVHELYLATVQKDVPVLKVPVTCPRFLYQS